jgi:hypothetical protein
MVEVELTENELATAKKIAEQRMQTSRSQSIPNRKKSSEKDIEIDMKGMAGELVVAKHLNLYPDLTIQTGAGGIDLTLHKGTTLDVKTTHHPNGKLIAGEYKKNRDHAQIFILVTGDIHEENQPFHIRGYETSKNLFKDENYGWLANSSKCYQVPQEELKPIQKLQKNPDLIPQ